MTLEEAYKAIMDHISVTDAMRSRILTNIQHTDFHAKPAAVLPFPARRMAVAAACLALLVVGAATLPTLFSPSQPGTSSGVQSGLPNMAAASSLSELSQLVGFEVKSLTKLPFAATDTQYMSYGGAMAQVTYSGETQSLVFRQTTGSTDPSGDYTVYADTVILSLGDCSVTLKGESGAYLLALWQDGTYSYSIHSSEAYSEAEWADLLSGVE